MTVLLVSDVPDHTAAYGMALRASAFAVVEVTSGKAALSHLQAAAPDCAVIDLRVADMSGWDLCSRIRQARPETRVVMLTPDVGAAHLERSRAARCHAWLTRPTVADDLVHTVRHVLTQGAAPAPGGEVLNDIGCPACASRSVRATLRITSVGQYYRCEACTYSWRVDVRDGGAAR